MTSFSLKMMLMIGIALAGVAGCSSDDASNSTVSSPTSTATLQGQAFKGPFKKGSEITAIQLSGTGRISGHLDDDFGHYTVVVPWDGLTKVEITGIYTDEFSGLGSAAPATLSSVVNAKSGTTVTANINIASTAVALLVDEQLKNKIPPSAIDLVGIEAAMVSKLTEVLKSPIEVAGPTSGYLFTDNASSHLLLTFLLATALVAPDVASTMQIARQYSTNVLANHPLGEPESGIDGGITRDALEHNIAALKFNVPTKAFSTGQLVNIDRIVRNLNLDESGFPSALLSTLSTKLPDFLTVPPRAYQQLSVGPCATGGSTAPPPKVTRGKSITFTFPVATCFVPSSVPLSMDLRINGTPLPAVTPAITGSGLPPRCNDWSNPACYLPQPPPPNPRGVCPAFTSCVLSQTKVITTSGVTVSLTVQTTGDTPLGTHTPRVIGTDSSSGEAGAYNAGWEADETFTFVVKEVDGTSSDINWHMTGSGSAFGLGGTVDVTFLLGPDPKRVDLGGGIIVEFKKDFLPTDPSQEIMVVTSRGAQEGCTWIARGQAPIVRTTTGMSVSGTISGTLVCESDSSPLTGTFNGAGTIKTPQGSS